VASEPERLEREIADTREQLGRDVDALAEKVSPRAAARRGLDRVKAAATSMRENVMGSTSDVASSGDRKVAAWGDALGDTASSAKESVAESAHIAKESVADAGQTAKQTMRRGTTGNPLAAGVIAFSIGWLASSLIPMSRTEQQLGQAVRKTVKEQGGPVGEQVGSAASAVAENLREPVKDAADQVRESAVDAASTVKDETKHHAADLAGEAKQAGQSVSETAKPG
jgi:gas vesicle protein